MPRAFLHTGQWFDCVFVTILNGTNSCLVDNGGCANSTCVPLGEGTNECRCPVGFYGPWDACLGKRHPVPQLGFKVNRFFLELLSNPLSNPFPSRRAAAGGVGPDAGPVGGRHQPGPLYRVGGGPA